MATPRRKIKAALMALMTLAVLAGPIVWIFLTSNKLKSKDVRDFGAVPEFSYVANQGKSAFLHFDTIRRVTLLLNLMPGAGEEGAKLALARWSKIKSWADLHLENPNPNDAKPQHINFVLMRSENSIEATVPLDVAATTEILLNEDEKFLFPSSVEAKKSSIHEYWVVISQEGRFVACIPGNTHNLDDLLQRVLVRLTSETYLMHYLTLQSLTWRKASDAFRGKTL